jgi:hypothetical protein
VLIGDEIVASQAKDCEIPRNGAKDGVEANVVMIKPTTTLQQELLCKGKSRTNGFWCVLFFWLKITRSRIHKNAIYLVGIHDIVIET